MVCIRGSVLNFDTLFCSAFLGYGMGSFGLWGSRIYVCVIVYVELLL